MTRRPGQSASYASAQELDACIDLLSLHRYAPDRYPFLLQSTAANFELGRFDILFACPGDAIILESAGSLDKSGGFLEALDREWRREYFQSAHPALPFSGGWFLYLGYELASEIEPSLLLRDDPVLPAAFAVRCPAAVVRDTMTGTSWVVAEHDTGGAADAILADIARSTECTPSISDSTHSAPRIHEADANDFTDAVIRAKNHIADGDVYQANLSREWKLAAEYEINPWQVYRALRASNPGPFAGLVRWKDAHIISSSPERLIRVRNGMASTRPIAGTRPRSADRQMDDSLSAELFSHPKERAEHVMLIDLERNDLGRICVAGSVEVTEMMVLETYAHVHHIVSNVTGRLKDGITPGNAIRAVFPGGTITGCPKVRCMQIINALEKGPRGAYTGSFGYLNRDGSMDLNILIRTMVQKGNELSFRAGSGIVADSAPDAELAETRAKAKGLLKAWTG